MAKVNSVNARAPGLPDGQLTARQTQVLQLLVYGMAQKQIGLELGISRKTVETHLSRARRKFDVSNNSKLIARAVARGDVCVDMGEVQFEIPLPQQVI